MVSTFRVETEDDEVEFIITISNGRRCKATQDPGRGDEGFCSEDNDNSNPNDKDDKIEGKKREIIASFDSFNTPYRECVRNLDLRVQVHPGELWVSKQWVHIVL